MMKNLNCIPDLKEYSVENFPILFQEESYNIYRVKHYGNYINPIGDIYVYDRPPRPWNFCTPDINSKGRESIFNCYGFITPLKLFQNLSKCEVEPNTGIRLELGDISNILDRVNNIISNTPKVKQLSILCDGGENANNIYIYRKELNLYERFTLRHFGDLRIAHGSKEIDQLLKDLKFDLTWEFQ